MVAEDCNYWHSRRAQEFGRSLGLEHPAVFRQVAGDYQDIRDIREVTEPRECPVIFSATNVEVADRGNSNPKSFSCLGGLIQTWHLTIHEDQAYLIRPLAQKGTVYSGEKPASRAREHGARCVVMLMVVEWLGSGILESGELSELYCC